MQASHLVLAAEEPDRLQQLRESQTAIGREVLRARVLWRYASGENVAEITRAVKMTGKSVAKWIAKAFKVGVAAALKDTHHWTRPGHYARGESLGGAFGLLETEGTWIRRGVWTRRALGRHVRERTLEAGYPALSRVEKATIQRILAEQPLHPERLKYYLERRDPDFEAKIRELLLGYREVGLQNQRLHNGLLRALFE
jgi:hypothetical protein